MKKFRCRFSKEELEVLGRDDLIEIFKELPAPDLEEMDGEFTGSLPAYCESEWRNAMETGGRAFWLGKSYKPEKYKNYQGHGLNRYRTENGEIARSSRFAWSIEESTIFENPSLVMYYSAFQSWGSGHDLIDEVRFAGPNTYLGLYHTNEPVPGFTPGPKVNGRSSIAFFFLTGPNSAFVPSDDS